MNLRVGQIWSHDERGGARAVIYSVYVHSLKSGVEATLVGHRPEDGIRTEQLCLLDERHGLRILRIIAEAPRRSNRHAGTRNPARGGCSKRGPREQAALRCRIETRQ